MDHSKSLHDCAKRAYEQLQSGNVPSNVGPVACPANRLLAYFALQAKIHYQVSVLCIGFCFLLAPCAVLAALMQAVRLEPSTASAARPWTLRQQILQLRHMSNRLFDRTTPYLFRRPRQSTAQEEFKATNASTPSRHF